jgi:hypothetical protein
MGRKGTMNGKEAIERAIDAIRTEMVKIKTGLAVKAIEEMR